MNDGKSLVQMYAERAAEQIAASPLKLSSILVITLFAALAAYFLLERKPLAGLGCALLSAIGFGLACAVFPIL